jgi:hypothetical protein
MPNALPPLSSTVSSVFTQFLKKLEGDKVLGKEALDALRQSLEQQKFDPENLRKAVLTADEPSK